MPGILPMKMIRVGSNSTSRIAQACDRCRSKKIRCDGMRPTCTQCGSVGFECKTSDKLSRRAFPRGYTESLEDRVRGLEAEVRELKDLLDERDEKIDMLSRLQNFSRKGSACLSPSSMPSVKPEVTPVLDEVLHVEAAAPVHASSGTSGPSTTSALIEAFESKVHDSDRQCAAITPASLLAVVVPPLKTAGGGISSAAPPRLLSDQYINLFFQEWQPLLPILHRQTFLQLYKEYIEEPEGRSWSTNKIAVAQLFLIFEIAAHSQSARTKPNTAAYESQWRKALSAVSSTPSIELLQCHLLAQLCYLLKADHSRTLRQRALAVAICQQLGLHRRDRDLSLSRLEAETRKKVFWSAYVLDKFTSVTTGMPVMLRDCDISTEYPADIDDENISTQGVAQALPGEPTKISSALALFRVSRILGKAYESLYPASLSFSLSLTKLHSLSDELDQWHEELPDHLRLRFCNDKPATNLISDRSPLLSLAYFYTRSLIHRPIVCHGSGSAASAATIVIAAAAKHVVQIIDLLDERCMNYTFPSNKQDLLMSATFSILWQCMQLDEESKLIKDNQKSLNMLLSKVTRENSGAGAELRRVVSSFVTLNKTGSSTPGQIDVDAASDSRSSSMAAPASAKHKSARKQIHAIASKLSSCSPKMKHEDNSNTLRTIAPQPSSKPRLDKTITASPNVSTPTIHTTTRSPRTTNDQINEGVSVTVNLDYFPLNSEFLTLPTTTSAPSMQPPKNKALSISPNTSWENLLTDVDAYNTIAPEALNRTMSNPEHGTVDWSHAEDIWHLSGYQLGLKTNVPQSLLSFSEESMSSGEDVLFSAPGSHNGSLSMNEPLEMHGDDTFKGIAMPVSSIEDDVDWGSDLRLHA